MFRFIKGFSGKIFKIIMIVALVVAISVLLITTIRQIKTIEQSVAEENKTLAEVAAKNIEIGYENYIWPFETLRKISNSEKVLFLWIVKPNGKILFADNPEMQDKVIKDPFLGTEKFTVRNSSYHNQKIKMIAHPLKMKAGEPSWTLFLGASLKEVEETKREAIFTGIIIFVLIVLLSSLISFYLSRQVVAPLKRLRKGAEIIGKGKLEHRIKIRTGDEIEELGNTLNKMAKDLHGARASLEIKVKARTREIRELNESLERKVKERTQKLQERVEELQKFHKLTVGREKKMIELKKQLKEKRREIKQLKKQLKEVKEQLPKSKKKKE